MKLKYFLIVFFVCLILMTRAAETKEEPETKEAATKKEEPEKKEEVASKTEEVETKETKKEDTTDKDNTDTEKEKTTKDTDSKDTIKPDDAKTTDTPKDNEDTKENKITLDSTIENVANATLDACGHTSRQFGLFSFSKPISKSVIPILSNFTIVWYYNNILDATYFYPTNNVTFSLYFEQDANSNDWSNAWKNPVWEQTIPMSEVETGPILTGNVKSFQWNWRVMYDENGLDTKNFKQSLRTNEKYKLRISGDGKDIQRNPELKCYQDGDITPGSTRPFYIVDNTELPIFNPIDIPDSAFSMLSFKPILQFIFPLFFIILIHFF
ncbi:hypothetical protein BCR36DRAFT_364590 [Piromyces finnis]|uniref:Uncharacterized protein n=1 Tax=Piromyces finnis TaxID=1754191 RepID=A0A1Y1UQU8_9FUNG|nr:hypothetical protein BCR36DRAFT_364590 [Piromyces finnis]|eukprot:ORX40423.1 hypothetical protein BCR36DRAFT_364590 [Piromyces finnis]